MENINLPVEAVCKQLFEGNSNSTFEITKLFNHKFLDKTIKWTGTIDDISEFNYDFVFKNANGIKATFDIYNIKSSLGNPKVKAVINFPSELLEQLKEMKGKELTFSGKMIKIDPSIQNIYITNGEVVENKDAKNEITIERPENKEKIQKSEEKNNIPKKQTKQKHYPKRAQKTYKHENISHDYIKTLQERKKHLIYFMAVIFVIVICAIIILTMKYLIEGVDTNKRNSYKQENKVIRHNFPKREFVLINTSKLASEFSKIQRQTKRMPQTNAKDIASIIKTWQNFVDANNRKYHNDPKLKQAKELIKHLKDVQKMYEK